MHNEKGVKDAVTRRLRKAGAWYTMPHQRGFSQRGVPDILACLRGQFIAIECKFGNRGTTQMQDYQLTQISMAGGEVLVVNEKNLKWFEERLEKIRKGVPI